MGLTPADPGYPLAVLASRVSDLESRLSRLEWAYRFNAQKATVLSFSGGAMCNVAFTATGTTAAVPYLLGYTPTAGHGGYVVDLGVGVMFVPTSSY